MKDKKNLKNLRLEKETISNLDKIKGGKFEALAADTLKVCGIDNSEQSPVCSGICSGGLRC